MHDLLLPGILGEIADVAGIPAALAIADQVGGTRINIPARAQDDHWLVATVGREAADQICDYFRTLSAEHREAGVRHVVIPMGGTGPMAQARRVLITELESGVSARQAARKAGVSERTAFRMRAKLREGKRAA